MANSLRFRITFILITTLVFTALLIFIFFYLKNEMSATRTEITDDAMVEKITSMGKLELVKYEMKDVIEKKEMHFLMPDSRVLFVAVGEVTACIDLTKIKKTDISRNKDTITVLLPEPEICYSKLDHQKSRVYDISGAWFQADAAHMVEDVYKLAEKRILDNARQLDVTGKARQNAQLIFKPLLESISGKKVILQFGQGLPNPGVLKISSEHK